MTRSTMCTLAAAFLLLAILQASRADDIGPYTLVELGTLGGPESAAHGINSLGHVVGFSYHATNGIRAFLRTDSVLQDIEAGWALKLNNVGQVIGKTSPGGGGYLWENGVTTPLGSLGTGWTVPEGINDAGQIVGRSRDETGTPRAFLWENGVMTDLGSMGGEESYGSAINDSGMIAGTADVAPGTSSISLRAFRRVGTTMTNLGSLYGASYGRDINAIGHVVGFSHYSPATYVDHAFLWTPETGMQDLGTLGGDDSQAYGINAGGQVVGNANREAGGLHYASIWSDGAVYDLNDLTTNLPAGWRLALAYDINDNGWIVGGADTPDGPRAFLLVPEPATLLLALVVAPCMLRSRRR